MTSWHYGKQSHQIVVASVAIFRTQFPPIVECITNLHSSHIEIHSLEPISEKKLGRLGSRLRDPYMSFIALQQKWCSLKKRHNMEFVTLAIYITLILMLGTIKTSKAGLAAERLG